MASDKRRALVLKAHENLVEIDKRNEVQFGAFLKSLSAELSRSKESLTEPKNPSN
jgi:two-component sensor histidine kinase